MKILKIKSLNINSLKGEFEIDFEKFLKDDSLFAITGPTGSGKSTILDIITCALYGRTARLSNPNELMSRHTGESFCEVEFEVKNKIYRSFWGINRARKSSNGKFQTPKMEIIDLKSGKILESYLSKVPKVVEEISGLDFDRFTQSMMLAQGSFDAFLKAKEADRSTLLEKITGTYIYKQISQEIYETYSLKKKEIEVDENSLGNIELFSKEKIEEKISFLENIKNQKKQFEEKSLELKKYIFWLEELQKLEFDNIKYMKEFEQIINEKESKKEDFLKLELGNKALNVQLVYQEKNSLKQIIDEDKQKLEELYKNLEDLKKNLQIKTEEISISKEKFLQGKISFESDSKKLQEVKILKTRIESKIQNINGLENKIKLNQEEKINLDNELLTIKNTQLNLHQELDIVDNYLNLNSSDEFIKEDISLISKNLNDYKEIGKFFSECKIKLQRNFLAQKDIKEEYLKIKEEFEESKTFFELKNKEYKELEIKVSIQNSKEQANQNRLKIIDKLIISIDEYEKLTQNILKEEGLILTSNEQLDSLKSKIQEKKKLLNELQFHIQTLNEKKEAQLLIAKYESDREKLKVGEECYLCGSKEHPFIEHKIDINCNNTNLLIEEKKQNLDDENRIFREYELSFSKLEAKLETAILEKDKLLQNKELIENIFNFYNFIFLENSKIDLEEEKEIIEKELFKIVELRDKKDLLLTQRDKFQEQLNIKQLLLSQKEQELYKLEIEEKQLELEQKQNFSRNEILENELLESYNKYNIIFDENYEERFNIIVKKRDEYIKNEISRKDINSKLQTILVKQKEAETKLLLLNDRLKKDNDDKSLQYEELEKLQKESKNILDVDDLENFQKKIIDDFNTISEKVNVLQNEFVNLTSKNQSLNTQLEDLIQKQNSENMKLQTLKESFEKILKENGFNSSQEFEKALLSKESREELFEICKSIEEKFTQIETLKNDTAKKLKEQKDLELTNRSLGNINDELNELQNSINELQKSFGSVEKELEINAVNMRKYENKIEELQKKKDFFRVWVKLNDMIGSANGDKFAKFAQGITLDRLIYLANRHLSILSSRYELQRSLETNKILELEVIDAYQGDVTRAVSTLSGGESFIVSLALALGLSNLASQKISIDSLFLDEGFGTLDNDSLELALNALNQLQSSGKMVGIISHVEALKERISLQIKVIPNGDGTSLLRY